MEERTCNKCGASKPLDEFPSTRANGKRYRRRYCKTCRNVQTGDMNALRLYGLPLGQYEAMSAAQGARCFICRETNGKQRLCVDHDHQTGMRRRLLCSACNIALGKLKEDAKIVSRAAWYLRCFAPRKRLVWSLIGGWANDRDMGGTRTAAGK